MRRFLKQFVYGCLYLFVLGLLVLGSYLIWFKPVPSCTNSVQDSNEQGVDCGGVCGKVCMPPGFKDLEANIPTILKPISGQVNALGKVTNYNLDLGSKSFSYMISLYDDKDAKIDSVSGTSFVYPGQIKYIPVFVRTMRSASVSYARLEIGNVEWVDASKFTAPKFRILDSKTDVASSSVQVSGKLANDDTYAFSNVQVLVLLRGAYGELEGLTKTELGSVPAGETVQFAATHPFVPGIDPQRTEVITYALR